jgi:hypothetical protein
METSVKVSQNFKYKITMLSSIPTPCMEQLSDISHTHKDKYYLPHMLNVKSWILWTLRIERWTVGRKTG